MTWRSCKHGTWGYCEDCMMELGQSETAKPIIFSGPMVRAIFERRKTQTRRVIRPKPSDDVSMGYYSKTLGAWQWCDGMNNHIWPPPKNRKGAGVSCPYGQPGDLLWVRETWGWHQWDDASIQGKRHPVYRADGESPGPMDFGEPGFWMPSIHMPRALSRLTLRITDVRVERLQDISEDDARAEGVDNDCWIDGEAMSSVWFNYQRNCWDGGLSGAADSFRTLWDSINANKHGRAWGQNPWVWALSFEVAELDLSLGLPPSYK